MIFFLMLLLAVAYPQGVVGCILALRALKIFMRINTQKEEEDAEHGLGHLQELSAVCIDIKCGISTDCKAYAFYGKTVILSNSTTFARAFTNRFNAI